MSWWNETQRGSFVDSNDTDIFLDELLAINRFWDSLENVYKPLELTIYIIGLAGNSLALITLIRSKRMSTPSFSYHRALVTAEFLYCANYFTNFLINRYLSIGCRPNVFRYWLAAFSTGTVSPAISSICNYVLHYVTTVIALDRVMALHFAVGYLKWNRPVLSKMVIAFSVLMSASVHSWSAYVQMEVNAFHTGEKKDGNTHQLLISYPCWNDTVVYYSMRRDNLSNTTLGEALKLKEIYNGVTRMIYSIVLTLLTLAVIAGLVRRKKKREAGRSIISLISMPSETTCERKLRKESSDSATIKYVRKRARGCEKVLFVLMIAVLLLAFFQVAASETSRVLQILYPPTDLTHILIDQETPVEMKLSYLRISMYGHFYTRLLASAFTAVERSFVCILYIAMNALFRQEVLTLLKSVCFKIYLPIIGPQMVTSKRPSAQATSPTVIGLQENSKLITADNEQACGCTFRSNVSRSSAWLV